MGVLEERVVGRRAVPVDRLDRTVAQRAEMTPEQRSILALEVRVWGLETALCEQHKKPRDGAFVLGWFWYIALGLLAFMLWLW